MKVWVVATAGIYMDYFAYPVILGVFNSEEKAIKYKEEKSKEKDYRKDDIEIKEIEVR